MSTGDGWIAAGFAWGVVAAPVAFRLLPRGPAALPGGARHLAGACAGLLFFGALSLATNGAEPTARAAIVLGVNGASAAFLALFLTRPEPVGGEADRRVGARLRRHASTLVRGVACYALLVPAVVALNAVNLRLLPHGNSGTSEALVELSEGAGSARFWLLLPALVVAVPCFEEVFARGLLQRGLAAELRGPLGGRLGTAAAVLCASLVFTGLHEPASYLTVFVLSLVLGAVAARTGGVAAAIGFHAAHNAFAIACRLWFQTWFEARGLA